MVGDDELANRFGYHPATPDTAPQFAEVRDSCLELAYYLDRKIPDGRDKSLALTALQEVMHWSNSAIAMQTPLATDPERART